MPAPYYFKIDVSKALACNKYLYNKWIKAERIIDKIDTYYSLSESDKDILNIFFSQRVSRYLLDHAILNKISKRSRSLYGFYHIILSTMLK